MSTSRLTFTLSSSSPQNVDGSQSKFGPRLGKVVLERTQTEGANLGTGTTKIAMDTPALFATTSRGVVPHISRDHYGVVGESLGWTCVPFESFLEHNPPVPVLYAQSLSSSSLLPFSTSSSHTYTTSTSSPSPAPQIPNPTANAQRQLILLKPRHCTDKEEGRNALHAFLASHPTRRSNTRRARPGRREGDADEWGMGTGNPWIGRETV
ncbi:hypothetical protein NMY22_g18162 [Coprinellus aureogranulatus]|nr:hypothetical protein NMY22_g18162 [Coprinellus aureogranulatus]